jgi:hypothetical protein
VTPFLRRIRKSRAQLLAGEAARASRWLAAIVAQAHAMGAIVPDSIDAGVVVFRAWSAYLERWAKEQDR